MIANLLPKQEHYSTDYRELTNERDVIDYICQYLNSTVANEEKSNENKFNKIIDDIKNSSNHVVRFDDRDEKIELYGESGVRVAYGAFRYEAQIHDIQEMWSFTFEILEKDDGLYFVVDKWSWLGSTKLSEKVSEKLAAC